VIVVVVSDDGRLNQMETAIVRGLKGPYCTTSRRDVD